MERIQTGGNLHSLYFINSVSVSHVYAGFFQGRSSVGELVLDYQVLRSFCVYERSNISSLGSNHWSDVFYSGFFQICAYRISRPWCDLVDHRPWEGNLFLIRNVVDESLIYKTFCQPFFSHSGDRILEFLAIVRAVIHRNYCQRIFSGFVTLKEQGAYNSHSGAWFFRTVVNVGLDKWEVISVGAF